MTDFMNRCCFLARCSILFVTIFVGADESTSEANDRDKSCSQKKIYVRRKLKKRLATDSGINNKPWSTNQLTNRPQKRTIAINPAAKKKKLCPTKTQKNTGNG
jgi:hypothetical protein